MHFSDKTRLSPLLHVILPLIPCTLICYTTLVDIVNLLSFCWIACTYVSVHFLSFVHCGDGSALIRICVDNKIQTFRAREKTPRDAHAFITLRCRRRNMKIIFELLHQNNLQQIAQSYRAAAPRIGGDVRRELFSFYMQLKYTIS